MGAIAHLYRGEVYRSTVWRTRLDNTTNWAVAALGLAMSAFYSHPDFSALPLILIGILTASFFCSKRAGIATSMSGARGPDGWRPTFTHRC